MLKKRLISGFSLFGLLLFIILLPGIWGAGLFLLSASALVIIAAIEFFSLVDNFGARGFRLLTYLCAVCIIAAETIAAFDSRLSSSWPIFIFLVLAVITALTNYERKQETLNGIFVSAAFLVLIVWPLTFLVKLYFYDGLELSGRLFCLFAMVVSKSTDTGAYAVGSALSKRRGGNHKIFPKISPKKSWEGLFGGIIAGVVCAVLMRNMGSGIMQLHSAIIFGLLAAPLGLFGDVFESLIKRTAGKKDSGFIPGLGGVLDIVDSLLLNIPVCYFLISIEIVR